MASKSTALQRHYRARKNVLRIQILHHTDAVSFYEKYIPMNTAPVQFLSITVLAGDLSGSFDDQAPGSLAVSHFFRESADYHRLVVSNLNIELSKILAVCPDMQTAVSPDEGQK